MFPNLLNFSDMNLYDLIQLVATIILAIAAITMILNAARINEQTMENNKRTADLARLVIQQNNTAQQTQMSLTAFREIYDIYIFFVKDIFMNNFFKKENKDILRERCNEILFQSAFLFSHEIHMVVEKCIQKILDAYAEGLPSYTEEEFERAKNDSRAGVEIKIYEAFINRENMAEDMIQSYEAMLRRTVFLTNIRGDITNAFAYFNFNLGPDGPGTI